MPSLRKLITPAFLILLLTTAACSKKVEVNDEQISAPDQPAIDSVSDTSSFNSIQGNLSFGEIASEPNRIILTGINQHRLVSVYKIQNKAAKRESYRSDYYYYDESESEHVQHFMPGIDLIYGYNLLNVAHYDMTTEKLNFLFDHPVLVKSLYYPSFEQDSIDDKPINRDYYLMSVYDNDTNADTLINKKDLRRFYYFNASGSDKTQLIPPDYSVVRSQYDAPNDVMYIFARQDTNHNGTAEKKEPLHVFWFDLKKPVQAKRLY